MIFFIFMQSRRKNILYHALRIIPFFYCDFHPHVRFTQHKNGDANILDIASKSRKVCCLCLNSQPSPHNYPFHFSLK